MEAGRCRRDDKKERHLASSTDCRTTKGLNQSSDVNVRKCMEVFQMIHNRLAASILALTLSATGLAVAQPYEAPAAAYAQDRGWDVPPQEFRDIQRQGFHDGVE